MFKLMWDKVLGAGISVWVECEDFMVLVQIMAQMVAGFGIL